MKFYDIEYLERLKRLAKFPDDAKHLIIDHGWYLFEENVDSQFLYLFCSNNDLILSKNGTFEKGKWEYLNQKRIIIEINKLPLLYEIYFLDDDNLVLKRDGVNGFAYLFHERFEGLNYQLDLVNTGIHRVMHDLRVKDWLASDIRYEIVQIKDESLPCEEYKISFYDGRLSYIYFFKEEYKYSEVWREQIKDKPKYGIHYITEEKYISTLDPEIIERDSFYDFSFYLSREECIKMLYYCLKYEAYPLPEVKYGYYGGDHVRRVNVAPWRRKIKLSIAPFL